MFARLVMSAWLFAWVAAVFWLAHKLVVWTVALWVLRWGFTGLALLLVAFLLVMLGLRLMWPIVLLLLGRETPRLAQREFRDTIANAMFFVKTGGLWKEPF